MFFIHTIAKALGLAADEAPPSLTPIQLKKLLEYGPFLDKVEEPLRPVSPGVVLSSVILQRDAANEYNGTPTPATPPITQGRVQETFGNLYLHYQASGEAAYLAPLKAMMNDLNLNPSNPQLASHQRLR